MYRLGSYLVKHLEVPPPQWLKNRLKVTIGEGEPKPKTIIDKYTRIVDELDEILTDFVSDIKARAKRKDVSIVDYRASCHKKKGWCGTCLGKYKNHWPYWKVKLSDGWRPIKRRDEKDFLRQFIRDDDLEFYYWLNAIRVDFLTTRNYEEIRFRLFGLIGEDVEVEPERNWV